MEVKDKARHPEHTKDEIIKRQALEIACLSARIEDQDDYINEVVQKRTTEFINENQHIIDENKKLLRIANNALKSLRILCRDEGERLKFLLAMEVFDEEWYRSEYPDVAENYTKGGLHHFCKFGIFEGRKPNRSMSA